MCSLGQGEKRLINGQVENVELGLSMACKGSTLDLKGKNDFPLLNVLVGAIMRPRIKK